MATKSKSMFALSWYNIALVLFISLGGLTYGFGFGVFVSSIGQPGFYAYFDLDPTTSHTASILGAVNSLFSFGAAVGALAQAPISDRLGRKKAIFVAATLSTIGGALTAGSVHIAMLIVVRLLAGVGLGMIVAMSPMYIAEISPPRSRGMLVGTFAVFLGFGYVFVGWISFGTYYAQNPTVQWRLPLALAVVPAIAMAIGVWFIPESPRWLIWNSRTEEARYILERIHGKAGGAEVAARAEYTQIIKQVEFDRQFDVSYFRMFVKPSWRKRSLLGMFVFFANQSTGVLGIGNFAILIYQSLGMTGSMPILMNAVYTTSATIIADGAAVFVMDRIGRRKLMLIGFPATAACLLAEALLQRRYIGTDDKAGNAACVFFLLLFIHIFDITIQCPTNVFVAEIWPTTIRSRGLGLCWFAYFVGAITYTTPSGVAFKNIGWKMYMVFFACNIVSTVIVYFYIPETANKTLEEMGDLFGDEVVLHITSDGKHFEEGDDAMEMVPGDNVYPVEVKNHAEEKLDM